MIPNRIAYLDVYVSRRDGDLSEDATRVVERYLHHGEVVGTRYDDDLGRFIVTAAIAFADSGQAEAERVIDAQRDRFSSGMYGTADPVWLVRV